MRKRDIVLGLALCIVFWGLLSLVGVKLHEGIAGAALSMLVVLFFTRKKR